MSVDIMTAIKQQAATLTVQEKLQLANYLLEQARLDQQPRSNRSTMEQDMRRGRLEWLKAHREVYGGQYVALDGTQLVAIGPNYRAAKKAPVQRASRRRLSPMCRSLTKSQNGEGGDELPVVLRHIGAVRSWPTEHYGGCHPQSESRPVSTAKPK